MFEAFSRGQIEANESFTFCLLITASKHAIRVETCLIDSSDRTLSESREKREICSLIEGKMRLTSYYKFLNYI